MKAGKKVKKPLQTTLGKASDQDNKLDFAKVRKPIHTSISNLRQVFSALQNATEEVKNYLVNECDIIYECRMCRSLFRSLANFIIHKRSYCQDKFSSLSLNHAESNEANITVELAEERSSKKSNPEKNEAPNKSARHDLTSVIEKLKDRADVNQLTQDVLNEDLSKNQDDKEAAKVEQNTDTTILLEKIASNNAAAFQTVIGDVAKEFLKPEYMQSEVMEIHNILDNDEAILGPDGKICDFKLNKNKSIQKNDLICTECNLKFSTLKTLTHHVKYKHNDTRLVYICPDCKDTFANPWCVYRHLLRIHRRTTAQIRRMREQIHNSVVKMKDYEPYKKKNLKKEGDCSNIDKTDEENQWLNNIEGDKDFQMCGGCGKRFERKAALHSHAQMCIKRIAVCNTIKENSARKKEEDSKDQSKVNKLDKTNSKVLKGASKRKPCIVRTFTSLNKIDDEETRNSCDVDLNCDNSSNPELRYAHSPRESSPVSSDELKPSTLEKIDTERMLSIIGVSTNYKAPKELNLDIEGYSSYQDLINQQLIVEIEAITKETATSAFLNSQNIGDCSITANIDKAHVEIEGIAKDTATSSFLHNTKISNTGKESQIKSEIFNEIEKGTSTFNVLSLNPDVQNLQGMQSDNCIEKSNEMGVNQDILSTDISEVILNDGLTTITERQPKQHEDKTIGLIASNCQSEVSRPMPSSNMSDEPRKCTSKLRRRRLTLQTISEEMSSELVKNTKLENEKMQKQPLSGLFMNTEEKSNNNTENVNHLDNDIQDILYCKTKVNEDTAKSLSILGTKSAQEALGEHAAEKDLHAAMKSQQRSVLPATEFQNHTGVNKHIQSPTTIIEDDEEIIRHRPMLRRKRMLTQETIIEEQKGITENRDYNNELPEMSTEQKKLYSNCEAENVSPDVDSPSCRISVRAIDDLIKKGNALQLSNPIYLDTEEIVTKSAKPNQKKRKLHSDSSNSIDIHQAFSYNQEVHFSSKAAPYMDRKKLMCIPCQTRFVNFSKLIKHMAAHFDWYRFQCSKCCFISFSKSDCSIHALENHNINSSDIPSVVLPIPDWKIDLMTGDFHELNTVDVCGEGYEDMIIECKEESVLVDSNELSSDSGVIYIDNLFEDSQNVEVEVEDICVNNNIKNESIDIIDEEKDSYKIDLSLEIYSTKIFEGISKLDGNDVPTERVNTTNPKLNVKMESDIESESEYYIPNEKKTAVKSLKEIKQEAVENLMEDYTLQYNNDDNVNMKANGPIKKILPTRNRKKSVKTLQNDFVYDFNKFFKLNDYSVNKVNSVQKQKKAPSSPTKASTSSTSKTVKISQKRK